MKSRTQTKTTVKKYFPKERFGSYLIWVIVWVLWTLAWFCGAFHSDDWKFATGFGKHIPGDFNLNTLYQAFWQDYLIRNGRSADVWARAMYIFPEPIWRLGMATLTVFTLWCVWRLIYFFIPSKDWNQCSPCARLLVELSFACLFFTMWVGDFTLVGSNFLWPAASIAYVLGVLLVLPVAYPFLQALKQQGLGTKNNSEVLLCKYSWIKIMVATVIAPIACLHLEIWASVLLFLAVYTLLVLRKRFPLKLVLPAISIGGGFFIQVLAPGHSARAKTFSSGLSAGSPIEMLVGAGSSAAAFWLYGWLPILLMLFALTVCLRKIFQTKASVKWALVASFAVYIATLGLSFYRIKQVNWLARQPHQGIRNPALNTYFSPFSSLLFLLLSLLLLGLFSYCILHLYYCHYWSVYLLFVMAVAVVPIPLAAGETVSRVYVDAYLFLYLASYVMFIWAVVEKTLQPQTFVKIMVNILVVTGVASIAVGVLLAQSWWILRDLPTQAEEIRQGTRQELVYPKTIPGGKLLIWNRPLKKYHPVIRKFYNLPEDTPIRMK